MKVEKITIQDTANPDGFRTLFLEKGEKKYVKRNEIIQPKKGESKIIEYI